ncbi:leucine-rich repeat domain-containing protein [Spirosoma arboris]|nr:COR domain-containing protein [Spirosoma arboris]
MSKLAIELICENRKTQDPFLDLGNCGLTELPEELFNCIWLEQLNLSKVYYSDETSQWVKSKNNGIKNSLYSNNILPLKNLFNLKKLYLSSNKISSTKPFENLVNLQVLHLGDNEIEDISHLVNISNLRVLDLSNNLITDAIHLRNNIQLQVLLLSHNKITCNNFLEHLTKLQVLYLNSNVITEFNSIKNLTKLEKLYLMNNRIENIDFIQNLISLKKINLSNNFIKNIEPLRYLISTESLNLSNNDIIDIIILNKMINLQVVDLSSNKIKDVSSLKNLNKLHTLDLRNNIITNIKYLENIVKLKNLDLSYNKIKDIKFLQNLISLQSLDLSSNEIKNIAFLKNLLNLRILNLRNNRISDISHVLPLLKKEKPLLVSLKTFDYKGKLNISDNDLVSPPIEIAKQGNQAILHYFDELEKQGTDYLYEAKMLIVGQPRAGKTSLRYKLFEQQSVLPPEEATTRGIDIQSLTFIMNDQDNKAQQFTYHAWDFGGQQIYQSTHQFFLTHRSLYVLVMDTGKDSFRNDDSTINYWLQVVELLGGNSPVVLLRNEKNERTFSVNLPSKKARFAFLKNDYGIDLNALIPNTPAYKVDQDRAFKQFRDTIEMELKHLPLVGFPMPKNWIKIREALQSLSQQKPYIYWSEYSQLCQDHAVAEYERQLELSSIFHDLGVFLHFQDYYTLKEFIILQNVWATDAVFAVLDSPLVKASKGKFTDKDLAAIWQKKNYDPSIHHRLLALMMQFELCYQVDNYFTHEYIVPEMLTKESPDNYTWTPRHDLPLHYRYDFMPKGILTRLIVRLHPHISRDKKNQQVVWKSGVNIDGTTMDCPTTFAEITEAWDNEQLLVRVQGKFPKELMSKITFVIDSINSDFFKQVSRDPASQKSKWYKMIPCVCSICKINPDKHFYEYSKLLERKEYGRLTIECDRKPFETVSINELLEGIFSEKLAHHTQSENMENSPKKIFISYSHKDEKRWKNKIITHLAPLKNQDLIESWNDRQIEAGLWDLQIEKAMEEADIFLLLITANFLASNYISSKEIATAYRRFKEGTARIFPVICDACKWELQPVTKTEKEFNSVTNKEMYVCLGQFQAFPKDARPIKSWTNIQDGFLDVINQLEKHL